jgi:hypothetical protein
MNGPRLRTGFVVAATCLSLAGACGFPEVHIDPPDDAGETTSSASSSSGGAGAAGAGGGAAGASAGGTSSASMTTGSGAMGATTTATGTGGSTCGTCDCDMDTYPRNDPDSGCTGMDCDDSNGDVHPNQIDWFGTPAAGTMSFDYNCDGVATKNPDQLLETCIATDCVGQPKAGYDPLQGKCGQLVGYYACAISGLNVCSKTPATAAGNNVLTCR